jgi:hypothetical protein
MSVLEVKMPSRNASGGIHFTGSIAFPPFLQMSETVFNAGFGSRPGNQFSVGEQ